MLVSADVKTQQLKLALKKILSDYKTYFTLRVIITMNVKKCGSTSQSFSDFGDVFFRLSKADVRRLPNGPRKRHLDVFEYLNYIIYSYLCA